MSFVQPEFPLWANGAPGALGSAPADIPTLTPFVAEPGIATGAALVICPGGGYSGLAPHEGNGYADFFLKCGITCFVLKYRLASDRYHYPAMFQDVTRAMRIVRANAAEWGVDPRRVGIIGSSAGGHLASMVLTHFDAGQAEAADPVERVSSRPDLGILCYAVITMGPNTHQGSKDGLLGPNPPPGLVDLLSSEKQVTRETPPCFVWHTWEDGSVKIENSLAFAGALGEKGVPFDLHIYQKGTHGIGLGESAFDPAKHMPWTDDCVYWLRIQKFAK